MPSTLITQLLGAVLTLGAFGALIYMVARKYSSDWALAYWALVTVIILGIILASGGGPALFGR